MNATSNKTIQHQQIETLLADTLKTANKLSVRKNPSLFKETMEEVNRICGLLNMYTTLEKFKRHNEFYKYSDIPDIAKMFGVEMFVNPKEISAKRYMAIFNRAYTPTFQVFINTGSGSISFDASHW
jgi:hypothetical protein